MKTTWAMATATALLAAAAGPALAERNPAQLDYLDTSTTRTLEARKTLAVYGFDAGSSAAGVAMNDVSLNYGVTDDLTALAQLGLGGQAGTPTGVEGWTLGLAYAPALAWGGWSPGVQAAYQGGLEPTVRGRAIAGFDAAVGSLLDGRTGRANLAGNLIVERRLGGSAPGTGLGYGVAASWPLLGSEQAVQATDLRSVQRDAEARLRLGVEANGQLEPNEPHYVIPAVYAAPAEGLEVAAGLGLKVLGEGPAVVPKLQLQLGF
jgi:hypothetical protein